VSGSGSPPKGKSSGEGKKSELKNRERSGYQDGVVGGGGCSYFDITSQERSGEELGKTRKTLVKKSAEEDRIYSRAQV